jgi:hypothetical protein
LKTPAGSPDPRRSRAVLAKCGFLVVGDDEHDGVAELALELRNG